MSDHERLRRPDPARTEPIRDWSDLYRKSDPRPPEPAADGAGGQARSPVTSLEEAINHGVEAGYRVIGEHIRRGQSAAQQFNPHPANSVPRPDNSQIRQDDIQKLLERIFQSFSDLVPFWVELFNTVATSGLSRVSAAMQRAPSDGKAADAGVNSAPPAAMEIEVMSARPARVSLDLHPGTAQMPLASHGLRAIDPAKPPLTDIEFVRGHIGQACCVKIRVAEDQPAGTYTGVVVDRNSGEPRGTLTVRIGG
jgi:hypothetical protein